MSYSKNPLYQPGYLPPKQTIDQPGKQGELKQEPLIDELPSGKYKPAGKLEGKVAIVTGGDSGIGRSVVLLFALEGADSTIVYLPEEQKDAEATRKIVEEKTGGKRKVHLIARDVRGKGEFAKKVVDETLKVFGHLDIVINNAAQQNEVEDIRDLSDDQWLDTFDINLHPYFFLIKAALPHLPPGSSIINDASINHYVGHPKLLDYSATKGAIIAFTRALSNQIVQKTGVRVNAVAPGPIWTPLIPATMGDDSKNSFGVTTPIGRPGQPVEVATSFVFLASDDSSYISGQTLHPNGGTVING